MRTEVKDWRGNVVPSKRAADLEPGDRGAGVWGREGTVAETIEKDGMVFVRWNYNDAARWPGDTAGLTAYLPDMLIPERDPLRGYTGIYLGD